MEVSSDRDDTLVWVEIDFLLKLHFAVKWGQWSNRHSHDWMIVGPTVSQKTTDNFADVKFCLHS